jgi:hypothetical protein
MRFLGGGREVHDSPKNTLTAPKLLERGLDDNSFSPSSSYASIHMIICSLFILSLPITH